MEGIGERSTGRDKENTGVIVHRFMLLCLACRFFRAAGLLLEVLCNSLPKSVRALFWFRRLACSLADSPKQFMAGTSARKSLHDTSCWIDARILAVNTSDLLNLGSPRV